MTIEPIEIPQRMNAVTWLLDRHVATGWGDRVAVITPEAKYTYRALFEWVNRIGNTLRGFELEPENRVLVFQPDGVTQVAAYLGAMKIGAVPVMVSPLLQPTDYEHIVRDSRARVLITTAEWLPLLAPALRSAQFMRAVLVTGTPGELAPLGTIPVVPLERLTASASPRLDALAMSPDDMAYWLYSSGTTGVPKGVVHLHHDVLHCQYYSRNVLHLQPDDLVFSTSKLFFAYALGTVCHMTLFAGATMLLYPDRPLPETLAPFVETFRPTLFFSVPTFYANVLRSPEVRPEQFSSVRMFLSAGEPLPSQVFRQWQDRFGSEICDGIGSTELTYTFISNRPDHLKPGSSGQVVPGNEVRIVDDQGKDLPVGEIGHLLVRAEATCAFYWNQHQRNKDVFLGHWFRTGDMYYRDEEGYFYHCGRSDDMLKVSGVWVSPTEVENLLLEHPVVKEACLIGHADANGNIKPKAFVVLQDGIPPAPELGADLQQFVKQRLAPVKYPRWVEFVPELPRTGTGKLKRHQMRQAAALAYSRL